MKQYHSIIHDTLNNQLPIVHSSCFRRVQHSCGHVKELQGVSDMHEIYQYRYRDTVLMVSLIDIA